MNGAPTTCSQVSEGVAELASRVRSWSQEAFGGDAPAPASAPEVNQDLSEASVGVGNPNRA